VETLTGTTRWPSPTSVVAESYAACYALSDILCVDETTGDTDTYCADHGGIASATVALNAATATNARLPVADRGEWEYARAPARPRLFGGAITVPQCTRPIRISTLWLVLRNSRRMNSYASPASNPTTGTVRHVRQRRRMGLGRVRGHLRRRGDRSDGSADGKFRATRGGAFRYDGALRCRSASRAGHTSAHRSWYLGFRVVATLPATKGAGRGLPHGDRRGRRDGAAGGKDYPSSLPFTFTRPDTGTPLTPRRSPRSRRRSRFFKLSGYFNWLTQVSHGNGRGQPRRHAAYKLFYGDMARRKTAT
jgi:hypothetical protein